MEVVIDERQKGRKEDEEVRPSGAERRKSSIEGASERTEETKQGIKSWWI